MDCKIVFSSTSDVEGTLRIVSKICEHICFLSDRVARKGAERRRNERAAFRRGEQ